MNLNTYKETYIYNNSDRFSVSYFPYYIRIERSNTRIKNRILPLAAKRIPRGLVYTLSEIP